MFNNVFVTYKLHKCSKKAPNYNYFIFIIMLNKFQSNIPEHKAFIRNLKNKLKINR